jgi:multiple sugar transport system permease protein
MTIMEGVEDPLHRAAGSPGARQLRKNSGRRISPSTLRNTVSGLLFISPWLVGLLVFALYPILASAYFSLTSYNIVKPPQFIGLQNYRDLFVDKYFLRSLGNTLYYAVFYIPASTIISVSLALLLNMKVKGMAFYRTVFYLPSIVPAIASSMLWLWVFNPQYGLANELLRLIGLPPLGWMSSPAWSKPSLIMMSLWAVGGGIVIFLAGLQDIPEHLYEAAELDGANSPRKIIHITIPLLTPSIFFNVVIDTIGAFQYFTAAFVMTGGQGGPLDSTLFYALLLYRNAFNYFKMGYASAMAWILFMIVFAATILIFRSSSRWVHFGG